MAACATRPRLTAMSICSFPATSISPSPCVFLTRSRGLNTVEGCNVVRKGAGGRMWEIASEIVFLSMFVPLL